MTKRIIGLLVVALATSACSVESTVTESGLAAPTDLIASSASDATGVNLTWTSGALSFKVLRAEQPFAAGEAASELTTTTAAAFTDATVPGEGAFYRVIAVSGSQQSKPSNLAFGKAAGAQDTDGDGLPDGVEESLGTDPAKADTDGDGLDDLGEVLAGSDPLVDDKTLDLDGDGLTTEEEIAAGTNAHDPDSDGDGVSDGTEVAQGTSPVSAADFQSCPIAMTAANLITTQTTAKAIYSTEAADTFANRIICFVPQGAGYKAYSAASISEYPIRQTPGAFIGMADDSEYPVFLDHAIEVYGQAVTAVTVNTNAAIHFESTSNGTSYDTDDATFMSEFMLSFSWADQHGAWYVNEGPVETVFTFVGADYDVETNPTNGQVVFNRSSGIIVMAFDPAYANDDAAGDQVGISAGNDTGTEVDFTP